MVWIWNCYQQCFAKAGLYRIIASLCYVLVLKKCCWERCFPVLPACPFLLCYLLAQVHRWFVALVDGKQRYTCSSIYSNVKMTFDLIKTKFDLATLPTSPRTKYIHTAYLSIYGDFCMTALKSYHTAVVGLATPSLFRIDLRGFVLKKRIVTFHTSMQIS